MKNFNCVGENVDFMGNYLNRENKKIFLVKF